MTLSLPRAMPPSVAVALRGSWRRRQQVREEVTGKLVQVEFELYWSQQNRCGCALTIANRTGMSGGPSNLAEVHAAVHICLNVIDSPGHLINVFGNSYFLLFLEKLSANDDVRKYRGNAGTTVF